MSIFVRSAVFIVLALLLCQTQSNAEPNTGGQLQRADRLESEIYGSLVDLVLSGDGSSGDVKSITVVDVSEPELRLDIALEGLAGKTLRLEPADADGRPVSAVPSRQFAIEGDLVSATLSLGSGGSDPVQTPLLKVLVLNDAGLPLRQSVYVLNKTWTNEIAPANVVVEVRASPVGQSNALLAKLRQPPTPSTRLPERTIKPELGDAIKFDMRETLSPSALESIRNMNRKSMSMPTEKAAGIKLTPSVIGQIKPIKPVTVQPVLTYKPQAMITAETVKPQSATTTAATSVKAASGRVLLENRMVSSEAIEAISKANKDLITSVPVSRIGTLIDTSKFDYAIARPENSEDPQSTEPTNIVGDEKWSIFSLVQSDVDVSLADEIGVEPEIFTDQNLNSGVVYFVPNEYRLAYDPSVGGARGLALRIAYEALDESGDRDDAVQIAMQLEASLEGNGLAIAQELTRAYAQSLDGRKFEALRKLPVGSPPAFDFSGALASVVDPDNIAIIAVSDFLESLTVSWRTNSRGAEVIRSRLNDTFNSLNGTAVFPLPSLSGDDAYLIDANVQLTNPDIFDAVQYDRDSEIRNTSPFPVKLKYLHALILSAEGGPRIYSWTLGDSTVPAQAKVALDLSDFPNELEARADRVWIDYQLDQSCGDCISAVIDELLKGGVWPETSSVDIVSLPSLFEGDVVEVAVETRSRFLAPSERALQDGKTVYLREGSESETITPVFLADQKSEMTGEEWPLIEYRLSVTRSSGETLTGSVWLPTDNERILVGSFQMQQSIPELVPAPNEDEAGPGE